MNTDQLTASGTLSVVIATWWETAEWVAGLSPRKGAKAYFLQHHEVHPGQPVDRVRARVFGARVRHLYRREVVVDQQDQPRAVEAGLVATVYDFDVEIP